MKKSHVPQNSVGGSLPGVQRTSEIFANDESIPYLASRIYASPSQKQMDNDARYGDKDTAVENIYHPSHLSQDRKSRSGALQVLNWLLTGKME